MIKINEKQDCYISPHDLELVPLFNKLIYMEGGKIIKIQQLNKLINFLFLIIINGILQITIFMYKLQYLSILVNKSIFVFSINLNIIISI